MLAVNSFQSFPRGRWSTHSTVEVVRTSAKKLHHGKSGSQCAVEQRERDLPDPCEDLDVQGLRCHYKEI